jgi:hypothetical protein
MNHNHITNLLAATDRCIYGLVTQTSAGGVVRRVRLFAVLSGRILDLTEQIAAVIDCDCNRHGLRVGGAGFNAVQHVVERLSHALRGSLPPFIAQNL